LFKITLPAFWSYIIVFAYRWLDGNELQLEKSGYFFFKFLTCSRKKCQKLVMVSLLMFSASIEGRFFLEFQDIFTPKRENSRDVCPLTWRMSCSIVIIVINSWSFRYIVYLLLVWYGLRSQNVDQDDSARVSQSEFLVQAQCLQPKHGLTSASLSMGDFPLIRYLVLKRSEGLLFFQLTT